MHIPYQKNASAKDLVAWLQRKNCARDYLLYKLNGLKALLGARSLSLTTGPKTIQRMIDALAGVHGVATVVNSSSGEEGSGAVSTPKDAATRAILEKSFLPHQKGKAREYCSLGHRLEMPILRSFGFDS